MDGGILEEGFLWEGQGFGIEALEGVSDIDEDPWISQANPFYTVCINRTNPNI
jgi:hypothetical protein